MTIWVDADACPKVIREVLVKAAERTGIMITFVANHSIPLPKRNNLRFVQVSSGFDVADNWIVQQVEKNDLVITSDIPLVDEIITKGGQALSSRGEKFDPQTIKSKLSMRDFMDTMRSSGFETGGPPPLSQTERREFANHLDRYLAQAKKNLL